MIHNGIVDAQVKIKNLNCFLNAYLEKIRQIEFAESEAISAMHLNGRIKESRIIKKSNYDRIVFHIKRILQEERVEATKIYEQRISEV